MYLSLNLEKYYGQFLELIKRMLAADPRSSSNFDITLDDRLALVTRMYPSGQYTYVLDFTANGVEFNTGLEMPLR